MKKIDMHNLKMIGLRKAASDTRGLTGPYNSDYIQISYNTSDGEVLTNYHCSLGHNSWTQYHDRDVIAVCNADGPMTMQQIADAIADAVTMHDYRAQEDADAYAAYQAQEKENAAALLAQCNG